MNSNGNNISLGMFHDGLLWSKFSLLVFVGKNGDPGPVGGGGGYKKDDEDR